jgi:hypothetical protein
MAAGDVMTQLAQAGATAIVAAMVTDAWQQMRMSIAAVLGRGAPERVSAEEAELEASREQILQAGDDERDEVTRDQLAQWRGSLRRLMATDPDAADDLQALVDSLRDELPAEEVGEQARVIQNARADRGSTVVQAGRDVTVDRADHRRR